MVLKLCKQQAKNMTLYNIFSRFNLQISLTTLNLFMPLIMCSIVILSLDFSLLFSFCSSVNLWHFEFFSFIITNTLSGIYHIYLTYANNRESKQGNRCNN